MLPGVPQPRLYDHDHDAALRLDLVVTQCAVTTPASSSVSVSSCSARAQSTSLPCSASAHPQRHLDTLRDMLRPSSSQQPVMVTAISISSSSPSLQTAAAPPAIRVRPRCDVVCSAVTPPSTSPSTCPHTVRLGTTTTAIRTARVAYCSGSHTTLSCPSLCPAIVP